MLLDSLEALCSEVERLGRPVCSLRIPGPDPVAVAAEIGHAVPEDVAAWFGWCNGISYTPYQTQDDTCLIPGYWPVPLEVAKDIRDTAEPDPLLEPNWIPLLEAGGGNFYAACFTPTRVTGVIGVRSGQAERLFDTIAQMVDLFRDLYRSGVFFVNDEGELDADDDRWEDAETPMTSGRPD